MKPLKIWNGSDWNYRGGRLYVAANSVSDAVRLSNAAYRKMRGLENRLDVNPTTVGEVKKYWHAGCWGDYMNDVTPERGVWHVRDEYGATPEERKPVRLI